PTGLVRRDGEVRTGFDVVDVGRHPVPPLLVAHVGGELGAHRRRGVGERGPQAHRLVVTAGDRPSTPSARAPRSPALLQDYVEIFPSAGNAAMTSAFCSSVAPSPDRSNAAWARVESWLPESSGATSTAAV